jgi:hypothetical protein
MSDLLKVNVSEHTEKKNGLTYLSWAWAWAEVLKLDPLAEWVPLYFGPETNQTPFLPLPDGSMMVGVTVHMKGIGRSCLLPVMDHRNKAIKNPDAFAVNTAMMRCLAKAIAMHGLGLYIYAGEDLPEGEDLKASGPTEIFKSLQPEIQDRLRKIAQLVVKEPNGSRMVDLLDSEELDNDEKAGLWSLLDSTTRATIKKAQQEQ